MNQKKIISAVVAGLMGAAVSGLALAEMKASEGKVECYGVNKCKGQGACGGNGASCAGTNSCKGKGWIELTKEECAKRKGKTSAPKKS